MSTIHSTYSTPSLSTTDTKVSDRSHSPSAERSSSPTPSHTSHANRRNTDTRRAAFKEKCQQMRTTELIADTEPQDSSSSVSSNDEAKLCELTDSTTRSILSEPEPAATKVQKIQPSRGCLGRNFNNIYVSGSRHGRKTIGSGSGAPAGCTTM